jgi:hypothetical protein
MPREAIRLGAVDDIVPIQHIPRAIANFLQTQEKGTKTEPSETTQSPSDFLHRRDTK